MRARPLLVCLIGAVLLIAAVAGFVIVPEHKPDIRNTYICQN